MATQRCHRLIFILKLNPTPVSSELKGTGIPDGNGEPKWRNKWRNKLFSKSPIKSHFPF